MDNATSSLTVLEQAIRSIGEIRLPRRKRYFAIVIQVDESSEIPHTLGASTVLGNHLVQREAELLPEGAKITRSIEITKDMATRSWV